MCVGASCFRQKPYSKQAQQGIIMRSALHVRVKEKERRKEI